MDCPQDCGQTSVDLTGVSNDRSVFPIITKTSQRQTSPTTAPEAVMGHHDGCHDMMFDRLIEFFTKMTRRDRRHKSVRDGSRRVWEAMRRVLPGLTTGSGTHRSRYENRDERRGWFVRPSVVLSALRIKMTAKIRTTRRYIIDNNMHFAIPHRFRIV